MALARKLASSVAAKITRLPSLSPRDARHLLDAARANAPDQTSLSVIVAAIDAKLDVALESEEVKAASTDQMLLTNAQCWVTESFMHTASGRGSIDFKLTVTAEYLANKLGCTHPHEQTYKYWLTLVLLTHYDVWPRYTQVYELLLQLKSEVESVRKKCPFARITEYPKMPQGLPEHIYKHIFGDEDPIVVNIERFSVTASKHVPLRKKTQSSSQPSEGGRLLLMAGVARSWRSLALSRRRSRVMKPLLE